MSDRLTTSQRKAKECATKAEDLCAVGDTDEATRLYEKACKLDPDNKRYRMGLESMHQQKESMGYFMEQLAKHKANRKYEKAAPDASQADVADAAEQLCRAAERGDARPQPPVVIPERVIVATLLEPRVAADLGRLRVLADRPRDVRPQAAAVVPLEAFYPGELTRFDHLLPQATFRLVAKVVPVRLLAPLRAVAPRAAAPARAILEHGLVGPADNAADVMPERLLHEGVALLVLALDLEAAAVLQPPHAELAIRSRAPRRRRCRRCRFVGPPSAALLLGHMARDMLPGCPGKLCGDAGSCQAAPRKLCAMRRRLDPRSARRLSGGRVFRDALPREGSVLEVCMIVI